MKINDWVYLIVVIGYSFWIIIAAVQDFRGNIEMNTVFWSVVLGISFLWLVIQEKVHD